MKGYIFSLLGAAIIAGIAEVVVPAGEGGGLKKQIRAVSSLIILCVIIAPAGKRIDFDFDSIADAIFGDFEEGGDYQKYEDIMKDGLTAAGLKNIESGLAVLLSDRFGVPEGECEVRAFAEGGGDDAYLSKVVIELSGGSIFKNPYEIEDYVSELLDCECAVTIS